MGFLAPLGFLFALSIPVLVLFYLLKVKRRPRRVSSTWLWRATVEDARASVPFQKLRRNLLMLLQILILALLAFALARPILNMRLSQAGSVLILVDASASMAMRDTPEGPTRLELAKQKATDLIQSLPDDVQALVLPYAARASVTAPFTHDRARLRRAVDAIDVQATGQDLRSALVLAASLVGSEPSPQIVVFSDRSDIGPREQEALSGTPLVVEPVGNSASNFGWTAFAVQRRSSTAEGYDAFGQIIHYGDDPIDATLRIEADGRLLDVRKVKLEPGKETPVVVEGLVLEGEPVIHARLSPPDGRHDALSLDNEIWTRVRPSNRIRLLLCSPGNYFLSRVLNSVEEIETINIGPGESPPEGPFDLAIYDRAIPEDKPEVPALYIGISPWQERDTGGASEEPSIPAGPITHWDSEHPVAHNVQWSTVTVFATQSMETPPGTRPLVESNDSPLLLVGRSDGQVSLVLTFDLFRSNLPLRAAFPIFIRNTVDWLTRDRAARETRTWKGGETFSFAVDESIDSVKVVSPGNRVWEVQPGPDQLVSFGETYEAGIWTVEIPGQPAERLGVSLLVPTESDPTVTEAIFLDGTGEKAAAGLGAELRANREIWRWLAGAALLILILEWALYRRPQTAG